MKRNRNALAVLLLLALPSVALADAGTPLMWASVLHLLFGNALIGLLEGALLAWAFSLSKKECIGLLILANYLSAWLGVLLISRAGSGAIPLDLHDAWPRFWLMVLVTYLITLVVEFPFVAFVFRRDHAWCRKAIGVSLLIQTASYVLLFGWYWMASGTSLYTKNDVVEVSAMSLPENVRMYFISAEDGDVYSGSLRDATWRRVFDLNSTHENDLLFVRPSAQDTNAWDILACIATDEPHRAKLVTIEERFMGVAVPSGRDVCTDPRQFTGTWLNFGPVPKLGAARASPWDFSSGFWPVEGLSAKQTASGKTVSLALETPLVAWAIRDATHLPGDKVLFQLGDDQICVYDAERKEIALLARGAGQSL